MTTLDISRLRDLALSDQGFVFDPLSGYTFTVNPTGLLVLRLLKEGRSSAEIVHELQEVFDLDGGEDVGRDVDEMILRLREQGLVK
jgi:PqqD family protein of HPr-rel-A system